MHSNSLVFVQSDASGLASPTKRFPEWKRWVWLAAIPSATLTAFGSLLYHFVSPHWAWLYLPFVLYYIAIPLLDVLVGEDDSSPSPDEIKTMEKDSYYVWVNRWAVFLVWPALLFNLWFVTHYELPWHTWPIMFFNISFCVAAGAVLGHTLAHSRNKLSRNLANVTNAAMLMGHLGIDHNRGHHLQSATPEDSSSAKMGQSIYHFSLQDYLGGLQRSWRLEAHRLRKKGLSVWHPQNEVLRGHVIGLLLQIAFVLVFGWKVLLFTIPSIALTGIIVGVSNYVTHYGLKRRTLQNGRYEMANPQHAWNSNHLVSNILLFHISRHSDHHAHPGLGYQSICSHDQLPSLPSSIAAMILLAFIPPLWFRVMDCVLVRHTQGELDRLNIFPSQRNKLIQRYGLI